MVRPQHFTRQPCRPTLLFVKNDGRLTMHGHERAKLRPREPADDFTRQPTISPASEMVWWGARNGRVVTNAVRSPVRPATRWIRVVSMASARVIAGRMVVSRRASIDLPAPGGPRRRTLWAERLHHVQLYQGLSGGAEHRP